MTHKEKLNMMNENEKTSYDEGKRKSAAAYKERKESAKKIVIDFLANNEIAKEAKDAIQYLIGTGTRSARTGVTNELKTMFLDRGAISEMDIFKEFSYGRPAMQQKINLFIKSGEPEDRIWVALEDGNYILKGEGAEAPVDWTGYRPVETTDL